MKWFFDRIINGDGNEIVMNQIENLEFITSTRLVIADEENHCLREMDMQSSIISTYAGVCSPTKTDQTDGHRLTEAKLKSPIDLQQVDCALYVIVKDNLKYVNLATDVLKTVYQFEYDPGKFFFDVASLQMYVIHPTNQIDILHMQNMTVSKLIGTTASDRDLDAVGAFNETRFDYPKDMSKLADDILLVSDFYSSQ